jgi:DegV family protein with EDD domain
MMRIAVVTDSTADLPGKLAQELQIHVIPNLIMMDGQSLKDGIEITRQEFYERLPALRTPATTATASSGVYQELFQSLLDQGFQTIISIHLAGKLSGVLNAVSAAAEAFAGRVQVIDSQQISMGLGYQAVAAAEAVARGLPLDEVLRVIESTRQRIKTVAMCDTLEYVRRSGRVSWARTQLANLLNIKPFLEVKDGQILRMGEARTRRKGIERLGEFLHAIHLPERLAVLHANAEQDAQEFLENLKFDLPTPPLLVNVTPVIGVHVGPKALGFTAVAR